MINPLVTLLMTRRAELNEQLRRYEERWRKGEISFQEYSSKTKRVIKNYYKWQDKETSQKDVNKDGKPKGLLGVFIRLLRRLS